MRASRGSPRGAQRDASRAIVRGVAYGLGGLVVSLLLALVVWGLDARPHAGVRLEGVPVPSGDALAPSLATRSRLWSRESITVEIGYHLWHPTREALGAALPVDEALVQVREVGRSLNPLIAAEAWWRAHRGDGHDLRWRPRIADRSALERYVQALRAQVDRLPTPGSLDQEGRSVAGLPGEALDVPATMRALEGALMRSARHVTVRTVVTPPLDEVRRFARSEESATVLMMRQETEYRAGRGRAINIELSARKLDGVVLMPGEAFSFNRVVGKRTLGAGFAPAHELVNGEVVLGVGGGVCQTAGTLHAAAFFAGLMVDEYRPHSRMSQLAYLRPGLDTMVAWPDHVHDVRETKDMRLRNPYPFPVVIRAATLPKSAGLATLRVELYGAARPFRVDYSFEEVERVPASEVRRVDPSLPAGAERVKQESLPGSVILRRRTIYMPTGRVEEVVRVSYPPTPRVTLVGRS